MRPLKKKSSRLLPHASKTRGKLENHRWVMKKNLPQDGVDMNLYPVSIIIIPAKQFLRPQGMTGQTSTSNGHKLHGYEGRGL